jgi:hypothetical protein
MLNTCLSTLGSNERTFTSARLGRAPSGRNEQAHGSSSERTPRAACGLSLTQYEPLSRDRRSDYFASAEASCHAQSDVNTCCTYRSTGIPNGITPGRSRAGGCNRRKHARQKLETPAYGNPDFNRRFSNFWFVRVIVIVSTLIC